MRNRLILYVKVPDVAESTNASIIENFVKNKAISRQYHTWFKWDENNANQFFGYFGADFKSAMSAEIKRDNDLQSSIRSFLEIGNERNKLIHQDYATFPLEKTLDEIYNIYQDACRFVEYIPIALREKNTSTDYIDYE